MNLVDNTSFSEALHFVRHRNCRTHRAGWHKAGLFVKLHVQASEDQASYLTITVNGKEIPWTPSQSDQLADDWAVQPV